VGPRETGGGVSIGLDNWAPGDGNAFLSTGVVADVGGVESENENGCDGCAGLTGSVTLESAVGVCEEVKFGKAEKGLFSGGASSLTGCISGSLVLASSLTEGFANGFATGTFWGGVVDGCPNPPKLFTGLEAAGLKGLLDGAGVVWTDEEA
jgi:hypothetical protein